VILETVEAPVALEESGAGVPADAPVPLEVCETMIELGAAFRNCVVALDRAEAAVKRLCEALYERL
jgi:hypothetical protein